MVPAGPASSLRVLVADDQTTFTRTLSRWLQVEAPGWTLECVHDSTVALTRLLEERYDLVLLDWHFSEGPNGLDLCRKVRAHGCRVPIVMLTVADTVEQRLSSFDAGVDEHLVKDSMSMRELCTRLHVAYHRGRQRQLSEPSSGPVTTAGPITVYVGGESVFVHGKVLQLPRHQRNILVRLARAAGQIVSHGELCSAGGLSPGPGFKNLHNEMLRLRQQLGPEAAKHVQTVRTWGYRLN